MDVVNTLFSWVALGTVVALLSLIVTWAVGGSKLLLRLGAWTEKFQNLEKTTGTLEQSIRDIRKTLDQIQLTLARRETVQSQSQSPLTLTDTGRDISTELGAQAWAEEIAQGQKGKFVTPTPYEIQEFCFNYVTSHNFNAPAELRAKMQNSAYSHGVFLQGVYNVLAIELRNKLLKIFNLAAPE